MTTSPTLARVPEAISTLEAQQVLPPDQRDQETLLAALSILMGSGHAKLLGWTGRVAFMLQEMTGQQVTEAELEQLLGGGQVPQGQVSQGQSAATGGMTELRGAAEMEAAAASLSQIEDPNASRFIGVPQGFTTQRGAIPFPGGDPVGGGITNVSPLYAEGAQYAPQSLSPTEIIRRQRELERTGLLERGSYIPGFWDQASADALRDAMGYANRAGRDVQSVIKQLTSLPKPVQPKLPLPERTVLPRPDPASIAQDVKSFIRSKLGREPTAAEMRELGGKLGGLTETQISQQEQLANEAALREYRGEIIAQGDLSTGPGTTTGVPLTNIDAPIGGTPPPPQTPPQLIDAAARFGEFFDQRFGPEMRRNEAVQGVAANHDNVMSSLLTMSSLIGGR